MNRTLLFLYCFASILFFSKTTAQAQTPLYSKYDTLVIGIAGVEMSLIASTTTTHTISSDMAAWAEVTNTDSTITVKVTQSNDAYVERVGHIYVRQGGVLTDVIVFIQPERACEKGMEGTAGKRFWVSFLENINGPDNSNTFALELVATSSQGASGRVTNLNTGYSSTFTVQANATTTLPITTSELVDQAYNAVGETVQNKALYVETDANITLYALNYENMSSDAANILPVEALGDEYYSLSYNSNVVDGGNIATPEEFLIVATENNTLVTIVPTATTGSGNLEGEPFLVKLNKGQTYLVKARLSGQTNGSLYQSITGTYIKSNKPIAAFSGHKRAKIGCLGSNSRDNLYDQLRPIHLWGHRYAVISTWQPKDLYRVLAAHDNTIITINKVVQAPLRRMEYRDYEVPAGQVSFIESNQPISVAQMGVSQDCMPSAIYGDPYLLLLNPVENQIFDITFTPFPSSVIRQHFVTILVNKENKSLTQLVNKSTSNNVSLNFIDIVGQEYSYAVTEIIPVTHSIHNDKGFIAFAFGYGSAESYAYSVGARFNTLPAPDFDLDADYCIGATSIKQFPDTLDIAHGYNWYDSPDDTATPLASIPIISTAVVGEFVYYLSQTVECSESPRRKITIIVRPLPVIVFIDNLSTICNTPYSFDIATPIGGTYTCPTGCVAGEFYPRVAGFGTYPVTYTYQDGHGCISTADTIVSVLPIVANPRIAAIGHTVFCAGDSVLLYASEASDAHTYQWLRDGLKIDGAIDTFYMARISGIYTLAIRGAHDCAADSASNPISVTAYKLPAIPVISPAGPISLCDGESILLTAISEGALKYQWYFNGVLISGANSKTYSTNQIGYYTVEVHGEGNCPAEDISDAVGIVVIYELPSNPILTPQSSTDFCKGSSVDLVADSRNAVSYEWYKDNILIDGVTGDTYTAYETGNYYVKALGVGSCYAQFLSNEVRVIVRGNPLIPNIYSSAGPPFYYGIDYILRLEPVEDGVRYEWYKDSVYSGAYARNYFISILKDSDAGVYYVEAINEYCTKRSPDFLLDPIEMPDLFIPNVFSPNSDGINDNFRIVGLEAFIENELTVVNNRGKLVYSQKNYNNTWYGENQPDDIYYYTFRVVLSDGATTTHRGYVYIKRTK